MTTNQKTLWLSKKAVTKAENEGEHHITFVASSANVDRDGEIVEIGTFRLPKKGGGHIIVSDIPKDGTSEADIPLLTDHDLYAVGKVIGSVDKAYFVNNELIFDCRISSRSYAQDVFTLVEEGHLDNAFSISFTDYVDTNSVLTDGEIIEVSLVTRGSNRDAQVLEVKSVKEEQVEKDATPTEKPVEPVVEVEAEEVKEEVVEAPETPEVEEAEAPAEKTEEAEPETTSAEVAETEEVEEPQDNTNEKGIDMANIDKIAKEQVVAKADQVVVEPATDYLKSKTAVHDFARVIADNKGTQATMRAWKANLESKGITGDAILPSSIEQVFFKTWKDSDGILSTFRRIGSNAAAAYAFTGTGENIRAKGHKKGETKAAQIITTKRRDLKAKLIYKKLPIDLQDLLDDTTGELLRFRTEELADRVANEIAVGAILGDGRSSGTPDYRVFDGDSRGLFSMVADLDGASVSGSYASFVANVVDANANDDAYRIAVKTLAKVRTENGERKVLIVPEGFKAELLMIQNAAGGYLFAPATDFDAVFGARVFELPELTDASGYKAIAYAEGQYMLGGTDQMVRTDFDLNTNQDVMLVERAAFGSLYGSNSAAGYAVES